MTITSTTLCCGLLPVPSCDSVAVQDSPSGIRSAQCGRYAGAGDPPLGAHRPAELDLADHHAVDAVAAHDRRNSAIT
ncbi:hypothetical protein [Nocardia acidivorans]|uniref:hypothetical protein n=1 Tax=Nocardia acidivorans TaxID=404580 RepID=UPI001470EBA6|nr:hypothetical protein [Nocardia acidivorans]